MFLFYYKKTIVVSVFLLFSVNVAFCNDFDDGIAMEKQIDFNNDLKKMSNASFAKNQARAIKDFAIRESGANSNITKFTGTSGDDVCINCTFVDGNANNLIIENKSGDIVVTD